MKLNPSPSRLRVNAKSYELNDDAIASVKESDSRIHFWYMIKDDAISREKNSNLNGKSGLL